MMHHKFILWLQQRPLMVLAIGCLLLVLSGFLMLAHARSIYHVKEASVPLVSRIPQMQRRIDVLQQQVEAQQLHAALQIGSQLERINVYVLPSQTDYDRVVAAFDSLRSILEKEGKLQSMSAVSFGDAVATEGSSSVEPLHISMNVRGEGVRDVLLFTRLAGMLSIADALTAEERERLLAITESENPAGITAMEQFLSADLLQYLQQPRSFDEQLQRSFTSEAFLLGYRQVIENSLVGKAEALMSGAFGQKLYAQSLWPLQMMTVDAVTLQPGGADDWFTLDLSLLLHREEKR